MAYRDTTCQDCGALLDGAWHTRKRCDLCSAEKIKQQNHEWRTSYVGQALIVRYNALSVYAEQHGIRFRDIPKLQRDAIVSDYLERQEARHRYESGLIWDDEIENIDAQPMPEHEATQHNAWDLRFGNCEFLPMKEVGTC
jgi:hypothetical protein